VRKFIFAAVVLAAALALAFLPSGARAAGYYSPGYGYAGGYYYSPGYSYAPLYYSPWVSNYTTGYPAPLGYGYGGGAYYQYGPGFQFQWHDHAWGAHPGGWGY
jgi:hypothetical protein